MVTRITADTACGAQQHVFRLMRRNASCENWNSTRLIEWLIRIAAPLPHLMLVKFTARCLQI